MTMRLTRMLFGIPLMLAALAAFAQEVYPARAIRLVVPFPAGGATDIAARLIAEKWSAVWKQPVVIDNRPGAGGNVGSDIVAKAAADGYTLVMGVTGSHAINASLYAKMPYSPLRDFEPIAQVAVVPNVLVLHPSVPANSLQELIAAARRAPGQLNYASLGNGTAAHLTMEMLKTMAGVDIVHVPYKGSAPALAALLGAEVQVMIDGLPSSLSNIRAGKLKALAVTSRARSPAAAEIPTIAESGFPGFFADAWSGLFAPKGTPQSIVNKLAQETARALQARDVRERLAGLGAEPVGSTPAEFRAFVQGEIEKWARVVKASGARVD
jgi:tripartite-type tricarboxylate transporter receptor subunit TctC